MNWKKYPILFIICKIYLNLNETVIELMNYLIFFLLNNAVGECWTIFFHIKHLLIQFRILTLNPVQEVKVAGSKLSIVDDGGQVSGFPQMKLILTPLFL